MGPRSASGDEASFLRVELQTQCAGEQRLNANAHLAILLSKKHRPVDLWTTRIAELPTSPTGLHYDGFSLSNSTRNDEEPIETAGQEGRPCIHDLPPLFQQISAVVGGLHLVLYSVG